MKREKYEQLKAKFTRVDAIDSFLKVLDNDDEKLKMCSLSITVPSSSFFHGIPYQLPINKEEVIEICKIYKSKRDDIQRELDAEW